MIILQLVGIAIVAIGLLLLYLEISGKKIADSKWLGMSGPIGLGLLPIGVVLIIFG